jgi:adenylylsulfate kinase
MSAREIHWHRPAITRAERIAALGAPGATLWFTGLSGSGKSTIACALEEALIGRGLRAYRLDGDNLRTGLNGDLGFSERDREENIRRIAEVARLFCDSGAIAIVGAISPFRRDRAAARRLHEEDREGPLRFIEVFVDAPLELCEARDPKGLYRKARAGELRAFTGIDSPYEPPDAPDLRLDTGLLSVPECVAACEALVQRDAEER